MKTLRCIDKYLDNNQTLYRLQSTDLTEVEILCQSPALIRQEILKKKEGKPYEYDYVNMILGNRTETIWVEGGKTEEELEMDRLIGKASLLDRVTKIETGTGYWCYLIKMSENHHILYIPMDVFSVFDESNYLYDIEYYINSPYTPYTVGTRHLNGKIEVVGGWNLNSTSFMFYDSHADIIDLTRLHLRKVESMDSMFYLCSSKEIIFGDFNTSNVKTMQKMFRACETEQLNFSAFDTRKVTNWMGMFSDCKAQTLDLRTFEFYNIDEDLGSMLLNYKGKHIILNKKYETEVVNRIAKIRGFLKVVNDTTVNSTIMSDIVRINFEFV